MRTSRKAGEPSLDTRLESLRGAAELAGGRLDATTVDAASAVVARAGARAALSSEHTAVALAGATGSGKSSLFNALTGESVAEVGVRRPTTSSAQAARWGQEGSGPLLDWLEVPRRHSVEASDELSGLVLLDLPDHDSIEKAHRLEAERLVEVVDLLVWVLDPQKYADAAVHERFLRPLARHRDVMIVVLNQVDRLPATSVRRCVEDLRDLLKADGLGGVEIVPVSARTGQGVPELRKLLAERVSRRREWAARLAADARTAADGLATAARLTEAESGSPPGAPQEELAAALAEAAGVPTIVAAVARSHRHRAVAATGWPVTRWLRRLRPDPLRRLRVEGGQGRSSLGPSSPVPRAGLDTAIREAGAAAAAGVPEPWALAVRKAARAGEEELRDALDQAVTGTALGQSRRPRWWAAAGALQWLLLVAAATGALWLLALAVVGYLQLPEVPTPEIGAFPWPTLLLLGGAAAGILLALLCRPVAWLGGRLRARRAAIRLRASVAEVGARLVLEPATAERDRYTAFVGHLGTARR